MSTHYDAQKPPEERMSLTSQAEELAPPSNWPAPPSTEAFSGLAGEFVDLVAPQTEADSAGLLYHFLTAAGCYFGRGSYFQIGGTRHYPNVFVSLVGQSSKSRKGTASDEGARPFRILDPVWTQRGYTGLSTGEGLIWAIRDPIVERVPGKNRKNYSGDQDQTTDPGVSDKRLLIVQGEFAQTLQTMSRPGNTLSPVIRLAWDNKPLSALTKSAKAACQDPHIAIVAHITKPELHQLLTSNENMNGFANRFLWVCVRRSKFLPFGGEVDDDKLRSITELLRHAGDFAQSAGRISFSPDAVECWTEVYTALSQGELGVLGPITDRSEAQTLRLAMIYALLDCSAEISLTHLQAGLAAWRYCADSARCIFGESLGNSTARDIRLLLRDHPAGLSRTQLVEHFCGHKRKPQMDEALALLQKENIAYCVRDKTPGRPVERWISQELFLATSLNSHNSRFSQPLKGKTAA